MERTLSNCVFDSLLLLGVSTRLSSLKSLSTGTLDGIFLSAHMEITEEGYGSFDIILLIINRNVITKFRRVTHYTTALLTNVM